MSTTLFVLDDESLEEVDLEESELVTTKLSIRKKTLVGVELLSSEGEVYKVIDCEYVRNVNPWWRFEFFNPMVIAKVSFIQTKKVMTSDQVYKTIQKSWRKHRDFWDAREQFEYLKVSVEQNKNSISRMLDLLRTYQAGEILD